MREITCQKGFTLIELMVALVIISVGVLALGAFTLAVLKSDGVAMQRTVATHLAEQELENWYNGVYVPAPGANGWPKTVNNTVFKLETFDATPSSGVWTNALAGSYNSEVRAITVYWQNKGEQKFVTVTHIQRTQ